MLVEHEDRAIAHRVVLAVKAHSRAEGIELGRGKVPDGHVVAQPRREVCGAMTLTQIMAVVVALAVVPERESGGNGQVDAHCLGKPSAMEPDAAPVQHAVDAAPKASDATRSVFAGQVALDHRAGQRDQQTVVAVAAFHPRLLAHAGPPIVGTGGRIPSLARGLALPSEGSDIGAATEQGS